MAEQFECRWGTWCRPTKMPSVYEVRDGGFLVRRRVRVQATGREVEIRKVLPNATLADALKWMEQESARVRGGKPNGQQPKTRFADFATALLERKVAAKDIVSEAGRQKWVYSLVHLIDGVRDQDEELLVEGFGEFFMDAFTSPKLIEDWKAEVTERAITTGIYAPTTCNTWFGILRVITQTAHREGYMPIDPCKGVSAFDESEHVVYDDDEPNSLTADEARAFLAELRVCYPQHFAMAALALATGLRPSHMRPLRRRGPDADLDLEKKTLKIRRSQTRGERAMNRTKVKGLRTTINLPDDLVEILKWHIDTQLLDPGQQDSDLLFPAIGGGFRSPSVLNKPFAEVCERIGLKKRFTQGIGMRRTFNDLARAAEVEALVTRSISGHLRPEMQDHYSTVQPQEQRAAIGKVIDLAGVRAAREVAAQPADKAQK